MPIWVDAGACPRPVKEILSSAADRQAFASQLDRWLAKHAV
jgi:uncharacterized protein YaiI (UPF0178 family)